MALQARQEKLSTLFDQHTFFFSEMATVYFLLCRFDACT